MDGGSPLACESNGHYYLGGLVTFGTACGRDEDPSMFVRVAEYVEWILDSYSAIRQWVSSWMGEQKFKCDESHKKLTGIDEV